MSLRAFVFAQPVADVHEHHIPEIVHSRRVNLLQLFQQSYAGWTQARPYPLPSEHRDEDPMLAEPAPTSWEALVPFIENSGSSSFVRNLVRGVTELHGDGAEITKANWQAIDSAVQAAHARPDFCAEVLQRARVAQIVTDPYTAPLLDSRATLGSQYHSVVRINSFACGWHAASRDHNGNAGRALLQSFGTAQTFDEYLALLEKMVASMRANHQVALKNALAYDRHLDFDEPNETMARAAWGKPSPSAEERKAFGDYIVDHFCQLAAKHDLPMQMHLGTAIVRGSHPLHVAGLIERHPKTRFLLMHLAYPWSRDLLALAFVYRNIWIDLTWSWLLSPSHFKMALHEAIEVLPDESRMMLGGDNWHIEETFATIMQARKLIAEVLSEKVATGYFSTRTAERLAARILRDNAVAFFRLPAIPA